MTPDEVAPETGDASALVASVRKSLEQSGYPLEMRVAAAMRRRSPDRVEQSRYYRDPITDKIRETDVVGCWAFGRSGSWTYVFLVTECKNKPHPWVVFEAGDSIGDDRALDLRSSIVVTAPKNLPDTELFMITLGDRAPLIHTPFRGTGIAEVGRSGGDRNGAWEAVLAAVSAAEAVSAESAPGTGSLGVGRLHGPRTLAFFVPVVVTSGALLRCGLDDADEVALDVIERADLIVRTASQEQVRCVVVSEAGLAALLDDTALTAEQLGRTFAQS